MGYTSVSIKLQLSDPFPACQSYKENLDGFFEGFVIFFFFYFSKVSSKYFLIKHCRVKRVLWVLLKSSYVLLFVSLQSFRYPYSNPSKESNNLRPHGGLGYSLTLSSLQFSSVTQSCSTLCDPMDHSTPGLPVHHQLPELTQTPVH